MAGRPPNAPLVLLADDEFIVRVYTAQILAEAGFGVVAAADPDEALSILETRTDIAALVTDVDMRGRIDGCTLATMVRERWPEIGVVINSGKVRPPEDRIPDGVPFLQRPLTAEDLLRAVRAVLRERERQAEAAAPSGVPALPTVTGPITDPGTAGGELAQPVAGPEKN